MQLVSALNWSDTAEKFGAIATQPVTLSTDPDWIFRIDGQFGQAQIRARYVQVDNLANPQQVQVIFHGNMPNTINQYSKVTIPIPDGASTVEIKLLGAPAVVFDVVARFAVNNINQTDSVNIYAITQAVKTGGLLKPINTRNGNYAVAASDLSSVNNFVIAGAASATLPDATATAAGTGNGFWTEIWNDPTSTFDVTILPSGVQNIDGLASLLLKPGQKAWLVSNGANFVGDVVRPISFYPVPGAATAIGDIPYYNDVSGERLGKIAAGAAATVLTGQGPGVPALFAALSLAQFNNAQLLTSGTVFNVGATVKAVFFIAVGAGGGSGGINQVGAGTVNSAGGQAGELLFGWLIVTPGGTVAYVIGAAGLAGTAVPGNGGAGGDTTFGGIIAKGGPGSPLNGTVSTNGIIPALPTQTGTPPTITGAELMRYINFYSPTGSGQIGGNGNSNPFGLGGVGGNNAVGSPPAAGNYGAAGGGSGANTNGIFRTGAAGLQGAILVLWQA